MKPAHHITPPLWTKDAGVQSIVRLIPTGRFVGGVVRDTLLDRPIGDIDFASPLPPDAVMAVLNEAGIKTIPTGIAHGTVTAVTEDRVIEITTLRRDVETDGRHAMVAFTDDWAADAARRDFTMNALYMDADGAVYDPTGSGLADCEAGQVRFVGDPTQRLAEDYLRLLRFYRFHAHYGRNDPDADARAACRAATPGLQGLAGERIRQELFKLLAATNPVPALRLMIEDGVLQGILPPPFAPDWLDRLIKLDPEADPILRLAALLRNANPDLSRLKLSVKETDRFASLSASAPTIDLNAPPPAQRLSLYRLGANLYREVTRLAAAEHDPVPDIAPLLALSHAWPIPRFPLSGADAISVGLKPGKALGDALRAAEAWWSAQDFQPARAACLTHLSIVFARISPSAEEESPILK